MKAIDFVTIVLYPLTVSLSVLVGSVRIEHQAPVREKTGSDHPSRPLTENDPPAVGLLSLLVKLKFIFTTVGSGMVLPGTLDQGLNDSFWPEVGYPKSWTNLLTITTQPI
jgi:hypothetical protein